MILINLLPQDLRKKETQKIVLPEIPIKKTLVAIGLSLLVLQLLLSLVAVFFAWRESSAKGQIQALSVQLKEVRMVKSQTVSALNKLKDIRALTDKKFYWASLLNAVSESLTRGVWLRSLSLDEVVEDTTRRPAQTSRSRRSSTARRVFPRRTGLCRSSVPRTARGTTAPS